MVRMEGRRSQPDVFGTRRRRAIRPDYRGDGSTWPAGARGERIGKDEHVGMAVYKRGRVWWYRFTWKAKAIRESTKQTNKRVAEQIEAAHKTSLAKGEVGIRDRIPCLTLKDFATNDFLPYVRSTFVEKRHTRAYYEYGVKSLLGYSKIAR